MLIDAAKPPVATGHFVITTAAEYFFSPSMSACRISVRATS